MLAYINTQLNINNYYVTYYTEGNYISGIDNNAKLHDARSNDIISDIDENAMPSEAHSHMVSPS